MLAQTNPAAIASNKNSFQNSARAPRTTHHVAPSYDITARIRQRERAIVENALFQGCDYWQLSKAMPKETFKAWLESQGKTLAEARKLIRLFETFRDFAIEKIERISLTTLFALTQKRYKQLLSKLWGLSCNELMVQRLMAEERKKQQLRQQRQDTSGLVNLPSGGRAFQFPLLHDDEAITQLLQVLQYWKLTPRQVLMEAIALLHGKLQVLPVRPEIEALAQRERSYRFVNV